MNNNSVSTQCQEVSKSNPCPLCGRTKWCFVNQDSTFAICGDVEETPKGWKKLSNPASDGRPMFVRDTKDTSAKRRNPKLAKKRGVGRPVKLETNEKIDLCQLKERPPLPDTEVSNEGKKTTYKYDEVRLAIRHDIKDDTKPKGYRKIVIPWHKPEGEDKFKKGKGDDLWPPYIHNEYWKDRNEESWVLGVEGEGCVETAYDLGLAAFTLDGSSWTDNTLNNAVKKLKSLQVKGIVYYPDNDKQGFNKAEKMRRAAAAAGLKYLELNPTDAWEQCPEKGDITDLVDTLNGKENAYRLIYESLNNAIQKALKIETITPELPSVESKLGKAFLALSEFMNHRFRYNTLRKCIELDGEPVDTSLLRLELALQYDIELPLKDAISVCHTIALRNSYSPVEEYLKEVHKKYSPPSENFFENLTKELFGTDNPLHARYLKRTLIAAVARTFDPGCKHDTGLILSGKQGTKKSTFWRALASDDWFTDSIGYRKGVEDLRLINKFWICEIPEFETVHTKKDTEELKRFMSANRDDIRRMHVEDVGLNDRRCILVGTTNSHEFLKDSTGSRRFWVVPVNHVIPIEKVLQYRDEIWAAATHLYFSGEKWWLSEDEDKLREEDNKKHEVLDPWHDMISKYVLHRNWVTTTEVLLSCIEVLPCNLNNTNQKRVGGILRQLGWDVRRERVDGKQKRVWTKDESGTREDGAVTADSRDAVTVETNAAEGLEPDCSGKTLLFNNKLLLEKKGDSTYISQDNSSNNIELSDGSAGLRVTDSYIPDSEGNASKPPSQNGSRITGVTEEEASQYQGGKNQTPPPTSKFKVGDKVEYVGKEYVRYRGKTLTVTVINKEGIWVKDKNGFPVGCCEEKELRHLEDT